MRQEVVMAQPLARSGQGLVYTALTVQTLISAGTYLTAKRALAELDPFTLVTCRFLLSAVAFVLLLAVMPGNWLPPKTERKTFLYLGFLAGPLNQGLLFYGLSHSTAAHAALLYALTPLAVYLLALAGVLVLLLGRGWSELKGPLLGDLFILGAVLAWALFTVDGAPMVVRHGSVRATSWSMLSATLLIVPFAPVVFDTKTVHTASSAVLGCIAYLAVMTSVVSYLLWYFALSRTQASKVAVFSNLQPVATAFAAWIFLGDHLSWEIAVGGVLVLAGVRLTQEPGVPRPA